MPTTRTDLPNGWGASPTITASGATAVLVRNTEIYPIFWAVTADDTAPAFPAALGHVIEPGGSQGITVSDGERLWLAARAPGLTVTVTQGAE